MGAGQWSVDGISGCHSHGEVVESNCASYLPLLPAAGGHGYQLAEFLKDKWYRTFIRSMQESNELLHC